VNALLADGTENAFRRSFAEKAQRVAHLGLVNSLTQLVLKCTVPGVPDIYQGNEVWDFSLVDPDNRRPVDFGSREQLMAALDAAPRALLAEWRDGRVKLAVTRALLRLRREHAELFQRGSYEPVAAAGRFAEHVVAFRRVHEGEALLVVVPRLAAKLGCPPLGLVWEDTIVTAADGGSWQEVFTGRRWMDVGAWRVAELFEELPVAVLRRAAMP
jgi:(1->4)-alpha-D-glucan 1-alpha-D-glucosylmutase